MRRYFQHTLVVMLLIVLLVFLRFPQKIVSMRKNAKYSSE